MILPEAGLRLAGRATTAAGSGDLDNVKEAVGSYWDNVKFFAYAIIALGLVFLLENLVLLVCCLRKRKRQKRKTIKEKEDASILKYLAQQADQEKNAKPDYSSYLNKKTNKGDSLSKTAPRPSKPAPKLPPKWLRPAPSPEEFKARRATSTTSSIPPGAAPLPLRASMAPPRNPDDARQSVYTQRQSIAPSNNPFRRESEDGVQNWDDSPINLDDKPASLPDQPRYSR